MTRVSEVTSLAGTPRAQNLAARADAERLDCAELRAAAAASELASPLVTVTTSTETA